MPCAAASDSCGVLIATSYSSRLNLCCLSFPILDGGTPWTGCWGGDTCFPGPAGTFCPSLSPFLPVTHRLPRLGRGQPGRFPGGPASWPRGPSGTWRTLSAQRAAPRGLRAAPRASCAQLGPDLGLSGVLAWGGPHFSLPRPHLPASLPELTPSFTGLGFWGLGGLGFLFPQLLSLGGSLRNRGHGERRGLLGLPSPSNPLEPPEIASDNPKGCCSP